MPPRLRMSKKCKNSHIIIILVSFLHFGVLPIIISKFMCCKLKKVENYSCRQSHVYTARWEINWPRWLMPERGLQTSTTHKSVFFDWKNRLTRLYQLQRTYYYKKTRLYQLYWTYDYNKLDYKLLYNALGLKTEQKLFAFNYYNGSFFICFI